MNITSASTAIRTTQLQEAPAVPTLSAARMSWIPRTVRCPRCESTAHERVRERLAEDEAAVRYACPFCRWERVRHYHENEGEGA